MSIQARGQAVAIERLSKRYGEVTALDAVSLEVQAGEFLALLGPSGSGKSTMLMSIAGFEQPDSGRILIGGEPITHLPAHRREIGMVFQRYALFPHLSVAENLAYSLRRRSVRPDEIARRVGEALALVQLDGYGPRSIDQLSGGQQQRVAVARALIFRPKVLLMDEPLSALDKKLRQQMQLELKLLHREVGITIILVTHDQEEALSMADRVALLDEGRLRQIGRPEELYRQPADAFVADFIGQTNFLPVIDTATQPRIAGFGQSLGLSLDPTAALPSPGIGALALGVRPEDVILDRAGDGEPCRVVEVAYGGATQSVLLQAAGHRLLAHVPAVPGEPRWAVNDAGRLRFRAGSSRIFDMSHQPSTRSSDHDA
jgi:spermidine/putrescine ABC transporter ATP-binding subunit